jgi:hypothetical protein
MGFLGDAWDWTKDTAGDVWDGVTGAAKDTFSQDKVTAYDPNQKNFQLGGDANFANNRASTLAQAGQGTGNAQRAAGGYGSLDATNRAGGLDQLARSGNNLDQARALGFQSQGNQAVTQGYGRAGDQTAGAGRLTSGAQQNARYYGADAAAAQRRPDVAVDNPQDAENRWLETQSRANQLQAAQALGYRANDGSGQANTQGLRDFAGQTGSGPSAAQSQLQMGADQSMGSALSLARSGRGNNTQAVRQAQFQNAATQQATNQQLATLRAQEYDQAQNRQLGALSAESQAQLGYRGQDINALQGQAGLLGQARGQDQSQQQLGIGQGQFNAQLGLQNRQLNDATALGWTGQAQTAAARGDANFFQGQQLGNQSIGQAQQYGLGLQQLGQQASSAGQQFQLGEQGLANQTIGQGQQFNLGMTGLGNQYDLGAQGLSNQVSGQQLGANMSYEGLKSGNIQGANQSNAQFDQQRDAANIGAVTSLFGSAAMMASDEHSKKQISSLKGELADTYAALGGKPSHADFADAYQGGNLPDTEYPSLPQDTRGPRVDLRPARGYSYEYKDPSMPGAAPGRHYGPMAQDLERSPATASTVQTGPDGVKRVDTPRLTLTNTAAISDQQRDIQAIKEALASNNSKPDPWHFERPPVDTDALDDSYRRQGGYRF